jgi:HSP20 family protein
MATLVHYNHFPTLFDSFFGRPAIVRYQKPATQVPAVNVKEEETAYSLHMAAPGLKKEDFTLSLEQNKLTIGFKQEEKTGEKSSAYTRQEFGFQSFERSFRLPKNVNTESISATYADGILNVVIPKIEPKVEEPTVKQIAIG